MAKPSAGDSSGSMGQLEADVTNAIWHAFDTLGDGNSGKAAKSRLKVFTSSLGTVLGYTRAEAALEEYCSTQELQFEQYMTYLLRELFSGLPSTLDVKTIRKYRDHIEDVCWLVCKKKYLDREFVAFPEKCVAQLFRVFCFLGELQMSSKDLPEVIMVAEEVEEVTSTFVKALGKEWDSEDFRQLAALLPVFHFQSFLAFLETRYTSGSEPCGLVEASAEVYDIYVGDVIKKGLLKKKMSTLGLWWEMYFVLRPHSFTYFGTKEGSRKSGEICITSRTRTEPVGDASTRKGHRFLVTTDEKVVELAASDYKSKLQWMSAIQTAAQHSYTARSYQRHLATKRRNERQMSQARKQDDERQRLQHLAQLEKEKEARRQAEEQLKSEHQKRQELEAAQQELERKLEEERQAKRDEEIVRTLQSRILAEEWEKREQLEQEKAEQQKQLEEESRRREHLEQLRRQKDREINSIAQKLSSLKTEKVLLNSQLEETQKKLSEAEFASKTLERRLRKSKRKEPALKRAVSVDLTDFVMTPTSKV
ncbi:switch-associated protein 70-like [Amblyomma americanum]